MEFLRIILIILLVYFGLRFILRLAGPYLLKYIMKKAGQSFEKRFNQQSQHNRQQEKEGEVTIDRAPKANSRKSKDSVGEYVDYEEVKD